jgi:hypothetical protein
MCAAAPKVLTCLVVFGAVAVAGCARDTAAVSACPTSLVGHELSDDFASEQYGDVPATTDSGHKWTQTAGSAASVPVVIGGGFTNWEMAPGASAAYLTAQLCSPATYLEAEFVFGDSGSSDGENVTLIAASAAFPGGTEGIAEPPDMALHVAFTPRGWIWSYIADGSSKLTTLKTVDYVDYTPGTARQRVTITLDTANSKAWVQGADGVVTEVSHPTIGSIPSPFVTVEVYYGDASTDRRAKVLRIAADSEVVPKS